MTATNTPAAATVRGGRRGSVIAVLLLAGLAIVLAGVLPFRQLIAQERLVDNTTAKLDALVVGNQLLRDEIDEVQSPAELERVAREQYGMAEPGETAYIVELEGGPSADGVVVSDQESDSRSPLERFWDFLTGRDLVPDG